MKKMGFFALFMLILLQTMGQFANNGATVTVQPGGYIFCAGSLSNNSGTLTNNGRIEVQGNFLNTASYTTSTNDDSLILSGSGNSTLNSGSSPLSYLTINKSSAAAEVKLAASATVNRRINLLQGKFTTDPVANPSFVLNAPDSTIFTFGTNEEIIGRVTRSNWKPGSLVVFNHPHFRLSTTGGTSPASISTLMLSQAEGGDPSLNEREVKRRIEISPSGGSGYSSTLRLPYLISEINSNVRSFIVPWKYSGTEWSSQNTTLAIDTINNFVTTSGITAASFPGEWKLADNKYSCLATAALRGPWNGSSMNTSLLSGGVLPLNQPYNVSPWNYAGSESVTSIPANVVDWVLVELRKPSSGLAADARDTTVIGRKAGFLLSNGAVVNPDGVTPLSFNISKQGSAFMVVRHRNHLGLISNVLTASAAGTFTNDFTQLANVYKPAGAPSNPVVLLSGTANKYGMWPGDANKSGSVNTSDVNTIKLAISQSVTGYSNSDVNLSNSINTSDVNLTKITISSSGTGSGARPVPVRTYIPDSIYEP